MGCADGYRGDGKKHLSSQYHLTHMLSAEFFDQDAQQLAQALLGKVLCVKHQDYWLKAMIIETEAYYLTDKASHASLGLTKKRRALFMPAGTIYMYYARGQDSLNVSAQGPGNAVLIKAAVPFQDSRSDERMMETMRALNPPLSRPLHKLCSGQTLLCRSLGLKVADWDQKNFDPHRFYIETVGYSPQTIIQTTRLGIADHRDPHFLYRFIDAKYVDSCTSNPLRKRDQNYYLKENLKC